MKNIVIRIATRKSPLAVSQAEFVKRKLLDAHPQITIELVGILTQADKLWGTPLSNIGGKGLFVKELEDALLKHQADIAVHSMKDVPAELPPGLNINVICARHNACDVLVSTHYANLKDLPPGAVIGTSSLRRQSQLKALRPDFEIKHLRGNVGTRIERLKENYFDAIILAAAGLERLHETKYIREYFSPEQFIPAIGQGAIGIESRADDARIESIISALNDLPTYQCISAERSMNYQFGGNCQIPIGAYATIKNQQLKIIGMVGKPDGSKILRNERVGNKNDAVQIGFALAQDLMAQGAKEILNIP
jgi:hydroxymethylbilane synthase